MKIRIKKLHEKSILPTYASPSDAGADLYSIESVSIHARGQRLVDTGIAVEIPEGYFGLIRPRSGLATKHGIGMNSSGVIDSGYRGSVGVTLINHTDQNYTISEGERIAQLVILPMLQADWIETDDLSESVRGTGGFGSTGS